LVLLFILSFALIRKLLIITQFHSETLFDDLISRSEPDFRNLERAFRYLCRIIRSRRYVCTWRRPCRLLAKRSR